MAIGAKKIETRSWETGYRGWLAIHASKGGLSKRDLAETLLEEPFTSALTGQSLQHGNIVAVVRLVACCPTEAIDRSRGPGFGNTLECLFGDFSPGRCGWITDSLFRLPEPIPFKGKQGLTEVPRETVAEIQKQWRGAKP